MGVLMTEIGLLSVALTLVATLFALLMTVLGWLGAKVINRLDAVVERLDRVSSELHGRISGIDTRVTVLEVELGYKVRNP